MAQPGSTSRSKTAYVAETTFGTTPATPAFQALRITSNNLANTPTRTTSSEIRADRQITEQVLTKLDTGGDLGIELSFGSFDDMMSGALQNTWVANPAIVVKTLDTEISDLSTTTATVSAGGAAFKAGHLVLTTGFPTPANDNILSRVASSTGTTVVFPAASFTAEVVPIPVGAALRVVGFMGAAGDITATATGLASTALDFTTLGLTVGGWHKSGGDAAVTQFATAADAGWARVSAVAAHAITYDILPTGWGVDAGAAKTIQVFFGDVLVNGTTQQSFTFERQQQDIAAPSFEYFPGQQVDQFSIDLKASAIITGKLTTVGMTAPTPTTARFAGATDIAAPTFPVLNASTNVGTLFEGGVAVSGPSYLMELDIDIKNNLAPRHAIGALGPVGVRNGELSVSGNLTAFFGDLTNLNQVFNDTNVAIVGRAGRLDGNRESLLFDIPFTKISGTSPVGAKSQDRMFNGTYAAKLHPTLGYTISLQRYYYLPIATT